MKKFSIHRINFIFLLPLVSYRFYSCPHPRPKQRDPGHADPQPNPAVKLLQHSRVPWIAHQLTDVAGPRLTNSPVGTTLPNLSWQTLKSWGFSNTAIEPWGEFGYGWSAEKTSLSMRIPYYSSLIAYAIPWSGSTHGPVSGPTFLIEEMDSAWVASHLH